MPPVATLDDLTAMMTADEHHRYEVSPQGVLSIIPPPAYARDHCDSAGGMARRGRSAR
jgi:hypothetical protein